MRVSSRRLSAPLVALFAAVTLFALFAVNVMSLAAIHSSRLSIARTRRAQTLLYSIRADIVDAETGQRGFLLTGRGDYLEPFQSAVDEIPSDLVELLEMVAGDTGRQRDVRELQGLTVKKLNELRFTVDLELNHETAAALAIVRSDGGKRLMDRIRALLADLRDDEDHRLEARMVAARRSLDRAIWIDAVAGTALLVLGALLFRINRDIARREQLERELREEVYFREQFIGILGHDLRNPLSAIMMNGRRLNAPFVSREVVARAGQIISSAAHRMRRMVDELLDMTRARRAGGIAIQRRPDTDLVLVARRASEELRSANPQAEVVVDAREPVFGSWDSDRLMQVVSNLVGNAIVHGRGRVDVRVRGTEEHATLEIHNGGPTLPNEIRDRLFEAFHGVADGGDERKGLGLGLFITERIVEAHGGRVEVHSTDEDGTTFTVQLPTGLDPTSTPDVGGAEGIAAAVKVGRLQADSDRPDVFRTS